MKCIGSKLTEIYIVYSTHNRNRSHTKERVDQLKGSAAFESWSY